jgi:hypothetical protein
VGKVINYFQKIQVGVVELSDTLRINDSVQIEGAHTSFDQTITSMQIDNKPIEKADAGQLVAIKVVKRIRLNDLVYRVE